MKQPRLKLPENGSVVWAMDGVMHDVRKYEDAGAKPEQVLSYFKERFALLRLTIEKMEGYRERKRRRDEEATQRMMVMEELDE